MIVIDTNILISAFIKNSVTRRILIESGVIFAYPEVALEELLHHKAMILKKGHYDEATFTIITNTLLQHIHLISLEIIQPHLPRARDIMESIDSTDAVFIATSFALDYIPLWSDDTDFDRQSVAPILKTRDMIKRFFV